MYLGNRKDGCIFKMCCIICVLFSTKFSFSVQIHFSQTASWNLSTLRFKMRVKDGVPGGEPIQTILDIQVWASSHVITHPLKTVKWHMLQKLVSRSGTSVWVKLWTLSSHLTFRHRASSILGQAFRYSPENAFYIFNQQIYFIIWYLLDRASLI